MKMLVSLLMFVPALALAAPSPTRADTLEVAPGSPRWQLEGNAKAAAYRGQRCLELDGGAALLKDFELADGVVDVDVATPARRGFFGIQFRLDGEGANGEIVYLRQHKSGLLDAMQYTPVLGTGLNWQLYSGPGFTGRVDIPQDAWFHLRLVVAGAQARLFVKDMKQPALVIDDLKSDQRKGQLALYVLTGKTCFANFTVRTTPAAAWERRLPPTPTGTLMQWALSPVFDALARDLEQAPSAAEMAAMPWQDVVAEPPGLVPVYRYREAPHLRVSFANDPAKRLEPQKGMKLIYARTTIDAERDEVRKLSLGYSDDVSVFLNGQILFRGRSAQNFRDPGFLGIVDAENDAVYLSLKKGRNELVLGLSELGGGWGFIGRLGPAKP